jgi:hypothetical protein
MHLLGVFEDKDGAVTSRRKHDIFSPQSNLDKTLIDKALDLLLQCIDGMDVEVLLQRASHITV